jgi:hypothetical protein
MRVLLEYDRGRVGLGVAAIKERNAVPSLSFRHGLTHGGLSRDSMPHLSRAAEKKAET